MVLKDRNGITENLMKKNCHVENLILGFVHNLSLNWQFLNIHKEIYF
jgi:hypothetical protein